MCLPYHTPNNNSLRGYTMNHYLNEKQVKEITNRALSTLRNDRFSRKGIPYIKVGRSVRYSQEDVIAFMEGRKIKTETT